jgi:TfoX/Sxy family transcriptional regulator of competence genes
MPYSEKIEKRIDKATASWRALEKKKMFGGICYLTAGNMCFGIYKDFLIVRLGEGAAAHEGKKHVRPFDITGRPMKGWLMVAEEGLRGEKTLGKWLRSGREFAESLPPK